MTAPKTGYLDVLGYAVRFELVTTVFVAAGKPHDDENQNPH